MRLKYQTAVATLIQFIVLSFLNIANAITSVVTTCHHDSSSCVTNLLTSTVLYILVVGWFGLMLAIGYGAQEQRSKRLAQLLIAAELLTTLVACFNVKLDLKSHSSLLSLSLITSLADILLGLWVVSLAYRLMRADGRRITRAQSGRPRKRREPPEHLSH
jgi:hypothetical protein